MSIKQQVEDLQWRIRDLQLELPDSPLLAELQKVQRELQEAARQPRRKPRLTIVEPVAPPTDLPPDELTLWQVFLNFHRTVNVT